MGISNQRVSQQVLDMNLAKSLKSNEDWRSLFNLTNVFFFWQKKKKKKKNSKL